MKIVLLITLLMSFTVFAGTATKTTPIAKSTTKVEKDGAIKSFFSKSTNWVKSWFSSDDEKPKIKKVVRKKKSKKKRIAKAKTKKPVVKKVTKLRKKKVKKLTIAQKQKKKWATFKKEKPVVKATPVVAKRKKVIKRKRVVTQLTPQEETLTEVGRLLTEDTSTGEYNGPRTRISKMKTYRQKLEDRTNETLRKSIEQVRFQEEMRLSKKLMRAFNQNESEYEMDATEQSLANYDSLDILD